MSDKENTSRESHLQGHISGARRRNWLRHTAMVPKGFIRFQVLGALGEKPMSGSELMERIEEHAGGFWKPSPGSIYPLLSWLQDSGYIKDLPTENGMKRYELTQSGRSLLLEQRDLLKKFRETMGFPQPPFRNFFMKVPGEKTQQIRETMQRAGNAMMQLSSALQENFSGQALNEAIQAIDEASGKLEEITKKLKGENKK